MLTNKIAIVPVHLEPTPTNPSTDLALLKTHLRQSSQPTENLRLSRCRELYYPDDYAELKKKFITSQK